MKGNTRFCSACGLLLTEVSQLIANGGVRGQELGYVPPKTISIRKQGVKQGAKMFIAGLVLVPLFGILSEIFSVPPVLAGLTALITFWGGILRIVYALIFEGQESELLEKKLLRFFRKKDPVEALPPAFSEPSQFFDGRQGMWRETSDLRNQHPHR
ncbi:MAG: hypothetical protein KIS76_00865 [Pyrinomonadaceae bacterium]|nr:hypothetical protein [Pyrinomonadaceae bacterium]